ncbi:MAG: GAF domain-containing protein [Anaerolineales bacterium]
MNEQLDNKPGAGAFETLIADGEAQKITLAGIWRSLVSAEIYESEETARVARLFNNLMIVGGILTLLFIGIFMIAQARGLFLRPFEGWLGATFPASLFLIAAFAIWQVKAGHLETMIKFYIWSVFVGLLLAVVLYDGARSAAWFLFFWPVMLAGTFMEPDDALRMALGLFISYGLVYLLEAWEIYAPPIILTEAAYRFISLAFGLLMIGATTGVVNFINMRSLRQAIAKMRQTEQTLQETRRSLEQRVEERTAELKKQATQLETITQLNRMVATLPDLQSVLDTSAQLISERLGYYHAGIFLLGPERKWAVLQAASSEGGQKMLARGHRLRVGEEGVVGYVAHTGLPRIALDVGEDVMWFDNPDLPNTRSEIALPLVARGQILGVLDIQTEEREAFIEDDIKVLRVLARGTAIAIDNVRTLEEMRDTLDRLARYQERDALQAWRHALARRNMQVDLSYVAGLTREADPQEVAAIQTHAPATLAEMTTLETPSGTHRLLAPIYVQGRSLGVLAFDKSEPWQPEELQLSRAVVTQLELALENARLLEETRLRASQERARGEIVSKVRSMGSVDAILRSAAEELGQALRVERSRIQLMPPGEEARPSRVGEPSE